MSENRRKFDDVKFFENYKFFINPETYEIEIRFVCDYCKKVMTREEMKSHYTYPVAGFHGPPQFEKTIFWCDECDNKRKSNNNDLKIEELPKSDIDKKKDDDVIEKAYTSLCNAVGIKSDLLSKTDIGTKLANKYHDEIDTIAYTRTYLETNLHDKEIETQDVLNENKQHKKLKDIIKFD